MYVKKSLSILSIFVLAIALLVVSCGKQEEKKTEEKQKTEAPADTNAQKPAEQVTQEKAAPQIPDIKGTYTGVFDSRATTLTITEQTDKTFKGKITINYREVINQEVSGEFDPDTKAFSMKDLLHSRYAGKYNGKFTDDLTKLSGTFTMNVDKTKLSFNLTKK